MKIYKYFIRLLFASVIVQPILSCDTFLMIDEPKTELATASVFSNSSTANAAITSIYARMATVNGSPFSDVTWLSGLSADEFTNYATNQNILAFHTNSLSPANPSIVNLLWTPYYNIIYQANAIIEGLQASDGVSLEVKNQITGEAKFVRAFYHFFLTGFFGEIPVITSTDYRINATLSRSPQSAVYQQIVTDLLDAKALLNSNYVGGDGVSPTTERLRPNRSVAEAMLARVYLYQGNYELAERESTFIIENSQYSLINDLSLVFNANSYEAIWQLQPVAYDPTTFADKYVFAARPASGLNRSVTLSDFYLSKFEDSDQRLIHWVGKNTVENVVFKYVNKHMVTANNYTEYNMVLRLAEQYLIRAEARFQLRKNTDGYADLNVLRQRAGIELFNSDFSDSNPFILVEEERQRELFGEGHRWFDLRRTDRIDEIMTIIAQTKGGIWNQYQSLYPIPASERSNNPNLSQNIGY